MKTIHVLYSRRASVPLLAAIVFLVTFCFSVNAQKSPPFVEGRQFTTEGAFLSAHPEFFQRRIRKDKSGIILTTSSNSTVRQQTLVGIPSRLNSFVFSPQGDSFVGFEEVEAQSDKLFFFDNGGKLIATQTINVYPVVAYSSDGQFVTVYNAFGREIFVFRENGSLLFKGDYIDLINDNAKVLYNVLVSESGSELLINAGDDVHLIDTAAKVVSFSAHAGRVMSGSFITAKGKLVLNTSGHQKSKVDVLVLSKSDGELLGKVPGVSKVFFTKTGFVTLINSIYQEYEVR